MSQFASLDASQTAKSPEREAGMETSRLLLHLSYETMSWGAVGNRSLPSSKFHALSSVKPADLAIFVRIVPGWKLVIRTPFSAYSAWMCISKCTKASLLAP